MQLAERAPAALASPLAGPEAVRAVVTRAAHAATVEMCLLVRSQLDERDLAPPPLVAAARDRGVRVRMVREPGAGAVAGAGVRVAPRVPAGLLIADARLAVVLPPPGSGSPPVAVGRSALLATLADTFELVWESAAPPAGADPDGRDDEILMLLAAGLTDEAAAARLGASARTVRRRVAALMRATGAATRFQAGAEAVRRGWL